jgi:segregation and condensation protein B
MKSSVKYTSQCLNWVAKLVSEKQQDPQQTRKNLATVEAALYAAGRPLELRTLCSILDISSKKTVQSLARALLQEYANRELALEILELPDGRFVMQLRPEYTDHIKRLAMSPLLTPGPLKTLSYIAFRQPVAQVHVANVRGPQAYDHVKILHQMGLIEMEKLGRTRIIRTTDVFADLFGLSHDLRQMKRQLQLRRETSLPEVTEVP